MSPDRFAALASALPFSPSRRGALRGLGSALLAATVLLTRGSDGPARKKRKKKKKGPAAKFAGGCTVAAVSSRTQVDDARYAQSFLCTRSGTLDEIRVAVRKEQGTSGNWVMQMVPTVNGIPQHLPVSVFAAAAIDDADVPFGDSTLRARFRGITLLAGLTYAVVVTRSGGASFTVRGGNTLACDDGKAWNATSALDFGEVPGGFDFAVSVFVV